MNRPGFRTLLLGSRFTAPPILLGSAYVAYRWWEAGGQGLLGLGMAALFIASCKAVGQVNAYRQWRDDWRAMGPEDKPAGSASWPRMMVGLLAFLAIALLTLWLGRSDATAHEHHALTTIMIGGGMLALAVIVFRLLRRLPWPRIGNRAKTVAIAIRRPVLHVPSIEGCYRRLPPYCQQLLKGRS